MEQRSTGVSQQSEPQAVPAARRSRPPWLPRPVREARGGAEARQPRKPRPDPVRAPTGTESTGSASVRSGTPAYRALSRLARLPRAQALAVAWSRLPNPRLTALGSGLLGVLAMLLVGGLDALLLDSAAAYGVCFLLVSAFCALWVRPADLIAAPVSAPLAFTAGLFFTSPGSDGFSGTLMGLVSGLSLQAGWVYAGTLLAGLIALVRRIAYVRRRRAERRAAVGGPVAGSPARHPRATARAAPAAPRSNPQV
ncbi:hypothetical protein LHJ74_18995 [Streptomyces sp. N2-109]|uniref:DUF6542 domain-containing protein n=1 Tax=Streptomyces gossypii TaxID=2883101 RepID=A0ABT2JVV0_9ACTN|nr:DUF6542 domain-containing protein [Streptomyces gossypii]MCT2591961.1 hypothetical protein [Streptomyces gossypii]